MQSNIYTAASLKNHMILHSGVKNHKCEICGKQFAQKGSLKKHQLTHSGIKNYKCNICSKNFGRDYDLKRHLLRLHEGK